MNFDLHFNYYCFGLLLLYRLIKNVHKFPCYSKWTELCIMVNAMEWILIERIVSIIVLLIVQIINLSPATAIFQCAIFI